MIISHEHRFVFVKTRKTAGSSIETALGPMRGAGGVWTRNAHPRRFRRLQLAAQAAAGRPRWRGHASVAEIRANARGRADEYFWFAFVRNPWDYVASRYFWERYRQESDLTLDDVLDAWPPSMNWEQITVDGVVAVDFVGRFENLRHDLDHVLERIGLTYAAELPRLKASTGRDGLHYRDLLEPRHVDRIRNECAAEIEAFGYEF